MESPLFRVSAALGIHLIVYCAIGARLAFGLYALLQPSRTPNSGLALYNPLQHRLAAADAKLVEDAFEHWLSELAPSATVGAADDAAPTTRVERVGVHEMRAKANDDLDQPAGIDKSRLVIATPRRYRNLEHLR